MENFRIQSWDKGYPGFYLSFGSGEQLNDFMVTMKSYDEKTKKVVRLCDAYEMCLNMPADQTCSTLTYSNGYSEFTLTAERVEDKVFHVALTGGWCPHCLVVDLNGTIQGDYYYFHRFDENSFFPGQFHEILEKVARDYPDCDFWGRFDLDDGDHFDDRIDLKYTDKQLTIDYSDDTGYWKTQSVSKIID